jgi:hypothetical protein
MVERSKDKAKPKKPYLKPGIRQVQLKSEETVLGTCKNSGAAGPASGSCLTLSCLTDGS